ncbi:MAG: DNA cytosine methyltransferase [Candidatus Didemnitutus sp.]|nr:DNA cytosine methyltransferase [Candidatus Didemnitutus sp.]
MIEMFSGAGLLSYAFTMEGFEPIQAVELCPHAADTYRRNLGPHVVQADIRNVDPVGPCDIITAGPPCQGFSTLGKRQQNDPRNFLSFEVAKWAELTGASVVVIENVAAFLDSPIWERLARRLRRLGYQVDAQVLNAVDFGVPQLRTRSFTIASKLGLPEITPLRGGCRTVRRAIDGLGSPAAGNDHLHRARPLSPLAEARIRAIPPGGDKRDIMKRRPELAPRSWWNVHSEATDVWGRMELDAPANTLRTAFINPSKGRYIHPTADRMITLREAARIHSIPDHWQFCGPDSYIARQIGNSVPPRMGRAVARAVAALFSRQTSRRAA